MALRRLTNNMNISESEVKSLIKGIRCWLLDMDGTVTMEEDIIPGAKMFFEALGDTRYIFATNNSSHSAEHYLKRLERLGIKADRDGLITSTDALARYIKEEFADNCIRGNGIVTVYAVGTPEFESEIISAGINIVNRRDEAIDAVLLGYDTTLTYEKLDASCEYIRAGVPFYAANPDKVCPLAGGKVQADCGAIIAFLETCTDRKITRIYGKPDPAMIEMILSRYGYKKSELAMVGDRVYTDLAFAKMAGIIGIGVLTGEATLEEIEESSVMPDLVFDEIADIAYYLKDEHEKQEAK